MDLKFEKQSSKVNKNGPSKVIRKKKKNFSFFFSLVNKGTIFMFSKLQNYFISITLQSLILKVVTFKVSKSKSINKVFSL